MSLYKRSGIRGRYKRYRYSWPISVVAGLRLSDDFNKPGGKRRTYFFRGVADGRAGCLPPLLFLP